MLGSIGKHLNKVQSIRQRSKISFQSWYYLSKKQFSSNEVQVGKLLWEAPDEVQKRSNIHKFAEKASKKSNEDLMDYWNLHKWSTQEIGHFWEEVSTFTNIKWVQRAEKAYVPPPNGKIRGAQWFPGSKLNFAENLMPINSPDKTVLVSYVEKKGMPSVRTELSGADVWESVRKCTFGLQKAGVRPNVCVAGVTVNSHHAITAMLSTTALGGVWSSCSPDFGVNGIVDRLGQIKPQVVFFSTGYTYGGKYFDCMNTIREVMSKLPPSTTAILIPCAEEEPISTLPSSNYKIYDEFIAECPATFDLNFEPLPFDHPLFIMFSSGTTGAPKCIVHGAGGTLLQQKKEFVLHSDMNEKDRLFYFTTCGWMMWNWMAASLSVGSSLVTYDGSPGLPDLKMLWQMIEQEGLTHFGTSPKFLSACMNSNIFPKEVADLGSLRTIFSTGSPLLAEHCKWVYDKVKSDVHLSSISGGTDILGCFMGANLLLPVRAGEIQAPNLGMAVEAWDDEAKSTVGERAELVCTAPFPSMPICFLNDPGDEKYTKAYFSNYSADIPETWWHGDFIEVTDNGGIIVHGRSDTTLNPGGVRIGTSELYRQVENFEEIDDSIAVGKKTSDGDVEVVLFVKMKGGLELSETLVKSIKQQIKLNLTPRHVPRYIIQVKDIPYTRSGKKVEAAVTKAIHNESITNSGALANAECLEQYYNMF